jgi:hypothetical protein
VVLSLKILYISLNAATLSRVKLMTQLLMTTSAALSSIEIPLSISPFLNSTFLNPLETCILHTLNLVHILFNCLIAIIGRDTKSTGRFNNDYDLLV